MSSRAVRRLLQQREQEAWANLAREVDEASEDEQSQDETASSPLPRAKPKPNLFAALNAGSESDDSEPDNGSTPEANKQTATTPAPTTSKSKKKKKNKNKKKNKKNDAAGKNDEQATSLNDAAEPPLDDVDAAIAELQADLGSKWATRGADDDLDSAPKLRQNLLDIDTRLLDADAELRRKFHMGRQTQAPRRGRTVRSSMVHPKDNWPRMQRTGLAMVLAPDEQEDGQRLFQLQHSPAYQEVQLRFLRAVRTMDPNAISAVLQHHPYHIDSLLQLSEVCAMGGDVATAADLVERAIYCLQAAFHPTFKPAAGQCRMTYRTYHNRALFLALFRHIGYVRNRGCYRAALELTRFLFSLDPTDDPLGALLIMDQMALAAGENDLLVQMMEEWHWERHLESLPNFAFSAALAAWLAAQDLAEGDQRRALLEEQAETRLLDALLRFPEVVPLMATQSGANFRPEVLQHRHFKLPLSLNSSEKNIRLLVTLYLERCLDFWKPEPVIRWLHESALRLTQRLEAEPELQATAVTHAEGRKTNYPFLPFNIQRHVLISNVSSAMALLPASATAEAVLAYDPLPPTGPGTENPYTAVLNSRVREEYDGGILEAFFQSLMPNFNRAAQAAEAEQRGRQLPADMEAGNLHQRAAEWLRSMPSLANLFGRQDGDEGEIANDDEMAAANLYLDEEEEEAVMAALAAEATANAGIQRAPDANDSGRRQG
ncbi:uncharacterized protein MONBRDRAFT_33832 [Monosiga brevicollis MX1]|uniref:Transcription factor 25 n=1 Tax=Monosiga brevicollis TaxID=81824 RepID=A9V7U0_MONBE|nr:uncharacterized protein MONBRDRAFT_33832 [Monosiga brevicollis MX1]EDQ86435.1 predicted protein [Monosiga brevicollis MX1]|eukprot:XP_001748825.1 hypothetical protein [Monosiga brevicollis MX1]